MFNSFDHPLLAAKDWWNYIVPAVFFIIYVLNQLLAVTGKGTKAKTPPKRAAGGQPAKVPPKPAPTGKQAQLNSEIEEFLKRASQRRGEKPRRETAKQLPPRPTPVRTLREEPHDIRPIEERELSSVAQSVEQHLGHRGFGERAEHLADDIVRADASMEKHVQQAFSRKVGTLASTTPQLSTPLTDQQPLPDAAIVDSSEIATLLANPRNVRQAVILSEVLTRPEHRW